MTTLTDTDSTKSTINNKITANNPATTEPASKLTLSTIVLHQSRRSSIKLTIAAASDVVSNGVEICANNSCDLSVGQLVTVVPQSAVLVTVALLSSAVLVLV